MKYLVAIIAIAILVKTGSLGKTFGFLMKNAFYPVLFMLLFGFLGGLLLGGIGAPIGAVVGGIVGIVKVFKDANSKLK